MDIQEIYLLTAFACAACDGEIAPEEVALVKNLCDKSSLFGDLNVEAKLNEYVSAINEHGMRFISNFLRVLEDSNLTQEEQLEVIKIAINMIEADGQILYSEVKFFKKLRPCLNIHDDAILAALPDKEDYLLPDIRTNDFTLTDDIQFAEINLSAVQ